MWSTKPRRHPRKNDKYLQLLAFSDICEIQKLFSVFKEKNWNKIDPPVVCIRKLNHPFKCHGVRAADY